MTTFGPVQIAADTDDGQENVTDPAWAVNGLDGDGNLVGRRSEEDYDMAMRWEVTVPIGATIDNALVELFCQFKALTGNLEIAWTAIDEDDTAAFSGAALPSARAQTSAINQSMTVDSGGVFNASANLASIVQAVCDRAGRAETFHLGIIAGNNGNANQERAQFQDFGNSSGDAARITIDYTAAAAGTILPQMMQHEGA